MESAQALLALRAAAGRIGADSGDAGRVLPGDVRWAVDYIHANLAQPITLADLVRESRVANRTFLTHFRAFKGSSPMRYVRDLRLERVREEILSGKTHKVGVVAFRWGFTHLGRFSAEYHARFGEYPSATLAQRRRAGHV
jgi:transcriptional regulator GlxA family with amidase domain